MLFGKEDHIENQIKVYEAQLEAAQEKLDALGNADTPETGQLREQIARDMAQIQVQLEQAHETQKQQQEQSAGSDLFND